MSQDQPSGDKWVDDFDPSLKELGEQLNELIDPLPKLTNYDMRARFLREAYDRARVRAESQEPIDELLMQARSDGKLLEQNAVLGALRARADELRDAYHVLGWDASQLDDADLEADDQNPLRAYGDRSFMHIDPKSDIHFYYEVTPTSIEYARFDPKNTLGEQESGELAGPEAAQLAFIAQVAAQAIDQAYHAAIDRLEGQDS